MFEEKYEICALKCDRGGEYRSGELVIYCKEKGINIKYTPVKEKQLHGKAEIFNRHVCEKARAMLFDSGLPKALWSEAVKYAAFVMNRCETQDCEQTPAEIAYGNNASFHRMRIFGFRAYSEPSDKMSERSTRMFFVGVGEGTYRLYDPKTRKVDEFRNVEFDEKWVYKDEVKESVPEDCEQVRPVTVSFEGSEENEGESAEQNGTNEVNETRELRRSERNRRRPEYLKDYEVQALNAFMNSFVEESEPEIEEDVPRNYEEAITSSRAVEWRKAMIEELSSMEENSVWTEVDIRESFGNEVVGSKWVYTVKNRGTAKERCKARLVALGYMERRALEPSETSSPVARRTTIRVLFSVAIRFNLHMAQYDIHTAYLYGELEQSHPIFMKCPSGLKLGENQILKLKRSLYGLRCSGKCWNNVMNDFLINLNFKGSKAHPCLYIRQESDSSFTYLLIYVDDLKIVAKSKVTILEISHHLEKLFKASDVSDLRKFVGFNITRSEDME